MVADNVKSLQGNEGEDQCKTSLSLVSFSANKLLSMTKTIYLFVVYVISSAGGQKNSTVTVNKTISLSLSEESVETLKDSADTSSQVAC